MRLESPASHNVRNGAQPHTERVRPVGGRVEHDSPLVSATHRACRPSDVRGDTAPCESIREHVSQFPRWFNFRPHSVDPACCPPPERPDPRPGRHHPMVCYLARRRASHALGRRQSVHLRRRLVLRCSSDLPICGRGSRGPLPMAVASWQLRGSRWSCSHRHRDRPGPSLHDRIRWHTQARRARGHGCHRSHHRPSSNASLGVAPEA